MTVGGYLDLRGRAARRAGRVEPPGRVGRGRGEDGLARRPRRADRQPLARLPAARRRRAGDRAQAEAAHPRRADQRPRPGADRRDARAHPRRSAASTPSCCRATSCRRSARPAIACWSSRTARSSRRAPRRSWPPSMGGGGTIEVEVAAPSARAIEVARTVTGIGAAHRDPRARRGVALVSLEGAPDLRPKVARALVAERDRPAAHRPRRRAARVDLPQAHQGREAGTAAMNATLLIARRELGAYLRSMTGYIIAAAVLLVDGLLFNAFALGGPDKLSAEVLTPVLLRLERHDHHRQRLHLDAPARRGAPDRDAGAAHLVAGARLGDRPRQVPLGVRRSWRSSRWRPSTCRCSSS